jgi:hypothetical protein
MSAIIARSISAKYFDYFKETNTMSAELSTLQANISENLNNILFSQVYDDACDAGFTIVNPKTGNAVTFYYESTDEYDIGGGEKEIAGWIFSITPESERKFPKLKGMKALVIND